MVVVRLRIFFIGVCLLESANAATTLCPLKWNADDSKPYGIDTSKKCPHGHRLKRLDVTIPNKVGPLEAMCIFWGVIPFLIIVLAVLDCAIHAIRLRGFGTRELSFFSFILFMVASNEIIFKRLVSESRPDRSCLLSCGMPSGHSTMSVGFFIFLFLDAVYRVQPEVPLDVPSARLYAKAKVRKNGFVWICRECEYRTWSTIVPLSAAHTLNQFDFITFMLVWSILLVPVPFSRIVLNDHTPKQVLVGGCIGLFEGVIFFTFVRHWILPKFNHLLGKRICRIIIHDFPMPVYNVVGNCYILIAQSMEDASDESNMRQKTLIENLARMQSELEWYIQDARSAARTDERASNADHKILVQAEVAKLKDLQDHVASRLDKMRELEMKYMSYISFRSGPPLPPSF